MYKTRMKGHEELPRFSVHAGMPPEERSAQKKERATTGYITEMTEQTNWQIKPGKWTCWMMQ